MFRTRLKWPTRHEESRLSYVSSCRRLMSYQVESYTYVATTATLRKKERPAAKIARLYRSVISQITLLYMRNIFDSDPELDNFELGGHVRSVNPATGQREYPCFISIATDRATYLGLNLRDVEPDVCRRHLNALVSHHPQRPEPVTPIRDFDLARYSFVEAVDESPVSIPEPI